MEQYWTFKFNYLEEERDSERERGNSKRKEFSILPHDLTSSSGFATAGSYNLCLFCDLPAFGEGMHENCSLQFYLDINTRHEAFYGAALERD
jgi:hypothetical protein